MGNTGSDVKEIPTKGMAMATVNLATNKYNKKETGEYDTVTSWHRLLFFGDKATQALKVIHKGDVLYVEGEIKYSQYDNKDGIRQTSAEIRVYDFTVVTQGNGSKTTLPAEPIARHDVDEFQDEVPF
jgi:single-strand DNA-binding protein